MERVIEAALPMVGAGAVELSGVNVNSPGFFVEVLKDGKRFT